MILRKTCLSGKDTLNLTKPNINEFEKTAKKAAEIYILEKLPRYISAGIKLDIGWNRDNAIK